MTLRYTGYLLAILSTPLWANLQVFPTRVEMNAQKRIANVSLRNQSSKTTPYIIRAVFYRMKPDGNLELLEKGSAEERSLVPYIKFSPRQVTLPPKLEQVVRVMFTGPKSLPDGEYRAHLHFEPVGEEEDDRPKAEEKPGKILLELITKVAISIPIVYKHGKIEVSTNFSDLKLESLSEGRLGFRATMTKQGNGFSYGDIDMYFTPNGKDKRENVGTIRGVTTYIDKREIAYQLSTNQIGSGILRLEFHEPNIDGKAGKILAVAEAKVEPVNRNISSKK